MTRPVRVMVLYWHPAGLEMRSAIDQHLHALDSLRDRIAPLYVNAREVVPSMVRRARPDAVVLHTTFLCMRWSHIFPTWKWKLRWLAELDCPKVAIPQDEYDHAHVLDEWLAELGVTVVVGNFGTEQRSTLYPHMHGRVPFERAFTGYIDEASAARCAPRLRPHEARPLDVVYRASHLPYWFGSHGQLKHRVGSAVAGSAGRFWLRTDISTEVDRTIVGDAWFDFLMSGRVVLGSESGSSVLDRRGEVRAAIQSFLLAQPELTFDEVSSLMPAGWDDYRFFALSPRHFEAVVTKTCQVLVEGDFDGILRRHDHYVPLARDFSNLDEVLERIRDPAVTQEIADRAYEEIFLGGRHTYREFARTLESHLGVPAASDRPLGRAAWRLAEIRTAREPKLAHSLVRAPDAVPRHLKGLSGGARQVHGRARGAIAEVRVRIVLAARLLALVAHDDGFRVLVQELVRTGRLAAAADDLVRLELLLRASSPEHPFDVEAELDHASGRLTLRSVTTATNGKPAPTGRLSDVVWDHRALGTVVSVSLPGAGVVDIAVGPGGLYHFAALSSLVRESERARDALWSILAGEARGAT